MSNKKPLYVLYTPVDMDKKFFLNDASNDFDPNSDYFKQWKFEDNLQGLIQVFTSNIEQAYNQYQKDNNWISLTDSLWQDYRSLFSSSSKQEHTPAQQNLITQYRKNADGHFRAAFNGTLLQFHDLHPEHAVLLLKRLLEYFIEEKDFKEFGSAPFTDDEIHKYNFIIRRIEAEIRTHQDRLKLKQLEDAKIIEASKEIITEEETHSCDYIENSICDQQNRPNMAENPLHSEVQVIPFETPSLSERSDSQKIFPNATVVPADKKTDSGQVRPIKWTKSEDQLKHLSTELKRKGYISDVNSFTCQFSVVGTQSEKTSNHVPADWIGNTTIFTYLFSSLHKNGILPQKLPLWSTLEKHFTCEGKSMKNLKQTHNAYKGRKPRGAQMIDDIMMELLK